MRGSWVVSYSKKEKLGNREAGWVTSRPGHQEDLRHSCSSRELEGQALEAPMDEARFSPIVESFLHIAEGSLLSIFDYWKFSVALLEFSCVQCV